MLSIWSMSEINSNSILFFFVFNKEANVQNLDQYCAPTTLEQVLSQCCACLVFLLQQLVKNNANPVLFSDFNSSIFYLSTIIPVS